ncbi:Transcription factor [Sesamum angolense]|uniref:Transcription factor n=1 Tax=Sesamum angolense TaxID=2727404 RepID=A0AAE1XER2_9LAMI|nr:Transcription factor [Sesamum angolense]
MDKTTDDSGVGDFIKHMNELEERVKTLEEQAARQTTEPLVPVGRSQIDAGKEELSAEEQRLPEIEAKVCHQNILLKIQFEKRKGLLVKVLLELDKLNLDVVSASVAQFGSFILDATILAEVNSSVSLF